MQFTEHVLRTETNSVGMKYFFLTQLRKRDDND